MYYFTIDDLEKIVYYIYSTKKDFNFFQIQRELNILRRRVFYTFLLNLKN